MSLPRVPRGRHRAAGTRRGGDRRPVGDRNQGEGERGRPHVARHGRFGQRQHRGRADTAADRFDQGRQRPRRALSGGTPGAERQFDASFRLDRSEPALRPGMTARVVIAGERLAGVQHLPRQVLFEKEGKPVVYVKTAERLHRHAREGRPPHREPGGGRRSRRRRRSGADQPRAPRDRARQRVLLRRPRWEADSDGRASRGRVEATVRQLITDCAARRGDAPRPQAAIAADDARDDLRGGGGRLDDVDRRRGAARGPDADRAARRAQPDRRGPRGDRLPGVPEGAQDLAGPDRAGPAGDPRERSRHHARPPRASATCRRSSCRSRSARCRRSTASSPGTATSRACGSRPAASSTSRKPGVAAPVVRARRGRAHGALRRARTRSAST